MCSFKIIELNSQDWRKYVDNSLNYDFYHTQSYNKLEKEGIPLLFVGEDNGDFIAFPLIVRSIPNSKYFDCTSVYGYCGPLSNLPVEEIPATIISFFIKNLTTYFKKENIISVFSRLHPLIEGDKIIGNIGGEIVALNKTIAIDLKLTEQEQKKQYRKSNKYEINKLKKNDFIVTEAKTKEEIDAFIEIYHETMLRVNATENYFFSKQYFYDFLSNDCFSNKLLLARKGNEITAGAIFTVTNKIMQYHLAGTKLEYSRDTPMKLILDEARNLGNLLNLDYLHLGGGVGGSDDDSLFKFKSGFSKTIFQYKIWKFIVNKTKYNEIVALKNIRTENNSFFPLYRAY